MENLFGSGMSGLFGGGAGGSLPSLETKFSTGFPVESLWSDNRAAAQLAPYLPQTTDYVGNAINAATAVIMYGANRAIDNKFGPANTMGNVSGGSINGQNGTVSQTGATQKGGGSGLITLLIIGYILFEVLD